MRTVTCASKPSACSKTNARSSFHLTFMSIFIYTLSYRKTGPPLRLKRPPNRGWRVSSWWSRLFFGDETRVCVPYWAPGLRLYCNKVGPTYEADSGDVLRLIRVTWTWTRHVLLVPNQFCKFIHVYKAICPSICPMDIPLEGNLCSKVNGSTQIWNR